MKKLLAFLAGAALTAALVGGICFFNSTAQAEDTQTVMAASENETTTQDIIDMLAQARSGITDEDTLVYYDKLVAGYQLTDSQDNPVEVPDIDKIQYAALTLPLEEAGKQIRDPEIREFYYQFLADSGFEIE